MEELTLENVGKVFKSLVEDLNIINEFCNKNNISMRLEPEHFNMYNVLFNTSGGIKGSLILKTEKNLLKDE